MSGSDYTTNSYITTSPFGVKRRRHWLTVQRFSYLDFILVLAGMVIGALL